MDRTALHVEGPLVLVRLKGLILMKGSASCCTERTVAELTIQRVYCRLEHAACCQHKSLQTFWLRKPHGFAVAGAAEGDEILASATDG